MFPNIFIEPDLSLAELQDPNDKMKIPVLSGSKATLKTDLSLKNHSRIFDDLAAKLYDFEGNYEDQCSGQYYFDLVKTLRDLNGEYDRVVEVGVYMGGSSSVFGGLIDKFDYDLDMVDIDERCLRYSYERIRRVFPDAAKRVRLFHGDLPHYVATVLSNEDAKCLVHHDGAHDFNQVVKDLSSLYFVREKVHAIVAQDTHLRGTAEHMNFVDLALYAVFGTDLKYAPIGRSYGEWDTRTSPNEYQGNYFVPDAPEGIVVPLALNPFLYPHPSMELKSFL
jgi:cephalosporin hydroxylase